MLKSCFFFDQAIDDALAADYYRGRSISFLRWLSMQRPKVWLWLRWLPPLAAVVLSLAFSQTAHATCGDYVTVTNPLGGKAQHAAMPAHVPMTSSEKHAPAPCPCSGPMCSEAPPAAPFAPPPPPPSFSGHEGTLTATGFLATATPPRLLDLLAGPSRIQGCKAGIEHPPR